MAISSTDVETPNGELQDLNSPSSDDATKKGKQNISISRDSMYYMESNFITFEVENRLYRVPYHAFIAESPKFSEIYMLESYSDLRHTARDNDHGRSSFEQGHSNIVKLKDVDATDFRCLLKVLYPLRISATLSLSKEEWISVLAISTEWRFLRIRKMAIGKLERLSILSSLEKISLGRELFISSWLIRGFEELVSRSKPLQDDEAMDVDSSKVTTSYKLSRLCELHLSSAARTVPVRTKVEETFADELKAIRSQEPHYKYVDPVELEAAAAAGATLEMEEKKWAEFERERMLEEEEQKRHADEEARRAEEEARRAEEEARRTEEEFRKAEEEVKRAEEEKRRAIDEEQANKEAERAKVLQQQIRQILGPNSRRR